VSNLSTTKISRTPPYADTEVRWDRTRQQIEDMIRDYGAVGISWASYRGDDILQFVIEAEIRGVRKELGIQVNVPKILKTINKKGQGRVHVWNQDQSYRLLYWFIKSKLEAVAYGLTSVEREFMSEILVKLPGGATTVGAILENYLATDNLEALPAPAPSTEGGRKVINVTYKEDQP